MAGLLDQRLGDLDIMVQPLAYAGRGVECQEGTYRLDCACCPSAGKDLLSHRLSGGKRALGLVSPRRDLHPGGLDAPIDY